MIELVVATKNKKKLQEIKEILKDLNLRITSLCDYSRTPRIVENKETFQENAAKKAIIISRFSKKLTLGEDSGLCVDALSGGPGVYSSRFAGKNKSDPQNNQKVLRLLARLPLHKRKAHYVCAVALADKGKLVVITGGRCSGIISFKPKGSFGFGYDPIFIIPRYKKTFAQLGEKIKHKMSHRYRALKKARRILEKYIEKHSAS